MSCTHAMDVGAYLFGSLDLRERSAFERHLSGCETCPAEMLRLAPLPGLLGRLTLDEVENLDDLPESPPAPPRPRRRWLLVAAAAVLVVAVAAGVLLLRPSPSVPTWAATDTGTGVAATAEMISRPWGTELQLRMRNVPTGSRCKLVVHDRKGQREIGGWWGTPSAEGEVVPGSVSFALDTIDHMDVMVDDRVLVTLRP
ncbi:zf-HC2 domain-containing protein [Lentzea tibetensis]|uniref:Zf-HC2 domain-containing protein n=1 Tax=Lentzea tibetensis TaxID=2591470 RepID=A0A563EU65_9PSEU|nr:zf-HC2 domain-containing protein [Lentzea tibetensis]TWP51203.1 zf-HC2 domain-containing protein [Lentzea tibetensis]